MESHGAAAEIVWGKCGRGKPATPRWESGEKLSFGGRLWCDPWISPWESCSGRSVRLRDVAGGFSDSLLEFCVRRSRERQAEPGLSSGGRNSKMLVC